MTPDELLDDYCREMEWPIPPEGSDARFAMLAMIEAAVRKQPVIATGAELIDWTMSDEKP